MIELTINGACVYMSLHCAVHTRLTICVWCDNLHATEDFYLFKTFHKSKDLRCKSSVNYLIKIFRTYESYRLWLRNFRKRKRAYTFALYLFHITIVLFYVASNFGLLQEHSPEKECVFHVCFGNRFQENKERNTRENNILSHCHTMPPVSSVPWMWGPGCNKEATGRMRRLRLRRTLSLLYPFNQHSYFNHFIFSGLWPCDQDRKSCGKV